MESHPKKNKLAIIIQIFMCMILLLFTKNDQEEEWIVSEGYENEVIPC